MLVNVSDNNCAAMVFLFRFSEGGNVNIKQDFGCRTILLLALSGVFCGVSAAWGQTVSRVWKDKTGKFQVDASIVSHDEQSVRLLKSDGLSIQVPVNVLSEADQLYLKTLRETEEPNPFAGGIPMSATTSPGSSKVAATSTDFRDIDELTLGNQQIFIDIKEPLSAIAGDAIPTPYHFTAFARGMEKFDAYARISRPLVADAETGAMVFSVHRNGNAVSPDNYGRLYFMSPKDKQPKLVYEDADTLMLVAYEPTRDRCLAVIGVDSPSDRGGDLLVIEGLKSGRPQFLSRWHLPEWQKPGFAPKVEWAAFVDPDRALVRVNDNLCLWTLSTGEPGFRVTVRSGAKPAISGTAKYLAIPDSGGCKIVDVAAGELLGNIEFPGTLTPEVQFSEDGKRLAMVAGNQFRIWNLESAGVEAEETIASTCGKLYGWVADQYLLTQFALIDVEMRQPVWAYSLPPTDAVSIVAGGILLIEKGYDGSKVLGLPVPHPPVAVAKRRLQNVRPEMLAVAPGASVQLEFKATADVDISEMESALKEAVERAGWKVSPSAPVKVVATISRGETEKLNFRNIGSPSFGASETVAIKPYRASLEVVASGKVLWQSSTQNMVPMIIHRKSDETIKQAVKKFERPDPGYFSRVTIPPRIFKPEFQNPVGTSRVDQGIWKD